jgi:hypothetical protein
MGVSNTRALSVQCVLQGNARICRYKHTHLHRYMRTCEYDKGDALSLTDWFSVCVCVCMCVCVCVCVCTFVCTHRGHTCIRVSRQRESSYGFYMYISRWIYRFQLVPYCSHSEHCFPSSNEPPGKLSNGIFHFFPDYSDILNIILIFS